MRTIVRPSRFSSEPTFAARSASDGSHPSSRRSVFTRRLELAALAPHAARPGVLAQRVNHRAADAPFGKRLELDAAAFIEAAGGVHEPNDPVLDEVADVNRMRHRRRDAAGKLFDERNAGNDARVFCGTLWGRMKCILRRPVGQRGYQTAETETPAIRATIVGRR